MLLRPQDIGSSTAGSDAPLFKFEFESDKNRMSWIIGGVGVALSALLYALGATLPNAALSGLAFMFAIATVLLVVGMRIRFSGADALSEDEIDDAVERFKQDLVDTYNGYGLEYSAADVLGAADEYRAKLEQIGTNAAQEDMEVESAGDVLRMMASDMVASHVHKKEHREAKRAEKAALKAARKKR